MKKGFSLLVAGLIMTLPVFSQENAADGAVDERKYICKDWSVGAKLGLLHFVGDIYESSTENLGDTRAGFGLSITKSLSSTFGLQGNLLYGALKGTDRGEPVINENGLGTYPNGKYFTTNVIQGGVNLLVNLNNLVASTATADRRLTLFGYGGIGGISFEPVVYNLTSDEPVVSGQSDQGNPGVVNAPVFPVGLLLKMHINKNWDLGLDANMNFVSSDKLDGWVVDGSSNDRYTGLGLSLFYHFGKDKDAYPLERQNPLYNLINNVNDVEAKVNDLTQDTDNDGVANHFDREANTPRGSKVYGDGTSVDTDGDGVNDFVDVERFTPAGAQVNASGKSKDSDNDGVPDAYDVEPNTPEGAQVNFKGETIKGVGGEAIFFPMVYFGTNSFIINQSEVKKVAEIANTLKNNPDLEVAIIGHADETGASDYNMKLAEKRANGVKKHLIQYYNISENRLSAKAQGESSPLAGHNLHTVNRRVEVKIME